MSGFAKAKAEQAALKIGIYGPPGSGKSFTSLLMAEGLAKASGKRVRLEPAPKRQRTDSLTDALEKSLARAKKERSVA